MKKLLIAAVMSTLAFGASAATLISKDKVSELNLEKIGTINVGPSRGEVSSPSDLHEELSKLADEKGGTHYVIIAAEENGPNFEAVAEVYK